MIDTSCVYSCFVYYRFRLLLFHLLLFRLLLFHLLLFRLLLVMSTPFLSTPVSSTPAIVCQYFYVSHFKYFYFTRISCSASLTTSLPGPAQNIFGRGLETRLTIMTMASLVPRPPPFFVLRFAFSIIHNTSRSIKEINQGTSAATQ